MAFVELEIKGQVGILTINRPEALNALNDQVISQLSETLDGLDLNTLRCLIVTGSGAKAFVAGADIGQMSGLSKAEGEAFGKLGILDRMGCIETDARMRTKIPGIFGAGDITLKHLRQIVTACGDGAIAANSAAGYVESLKQ